MEKQPDVIDVKIEYCRKCGSSLDSTRHCTGCGKQYLHINKKHFLKGYAILTTLLVLGGSCLGFYNYSEWEKEFNRANLLTQENSTLKEDVELERRRKNEAKQESQSFLLQIGDLHQELTSVNNELAVYKKHAVFVTENGTKYHQSRCAHIKNRSCWIYNVEAAEGRGYTACADCWESE